MGTQERVARVLVTIDEPYADEEYWREVADQYLKFNGSRSAIYQPSATERVEFIEWEPEDPDLAKSESIRRMEFLVEHYGVTIKEFEDGWWYIDPIYNWWVGPDPNYVDCLMEATDDLTEP